MNEEAIKVMHELARKEGFEGSVDDFKSLMKSNEGALSTMYELAKEEGYEKDQSSFAELMGVTLKKKDPGTAESASVPPSTSQPEPATPDQPPVEMRPIRFEGGLQGGVAATRPYDNERGGYILEPNEIKSRLNNEDLGPADFGEAPIDKNMTWQDMLGMPQEQAESVLNYEGRQLLDYVREEDAAVKQGAAKLLSDPLPPAPGVETARESTDTTFDPQIEERQFADAKPEIPLADGGDKVLYDLNGYSTVNTSEQGITSYLDQKAQQMGAEDFGAADDAQKKEILRQFSDRYVDKESMDQVMKDMGQDLDASGWQQAWSSFASGVEGMYGGTANEIGRIIDRGGEFLKESIGALPDDALSQQVRFENRERLLQANRKSQRKKALAAIGAYRTNPKYKDSFLKTVLPSAAGSMAAIVSTGGRMGGAIIGAGANADQQATQAFQKGAGDGDALVAELVGAGIGASESLPVARALKRFSTPVQNKIRTSMKVLKSSGEEALQEATAGALNNLTAQQLYDESQKIFDESLWQEAGAGAVMGLVMGIGGAISQKLMDKSLKEQERKMLEEQQAKMKKLYERYNPPENAPDNTQEGQEESQAPESQEDPESPGTPPVEGEDVTGVEADEYEGDVTPEPVEPVDPPEPEQVKPPVDEIPDAVPINETNETDARLPEGENPDQAPTPEQTETPQETEVDEEGVDFDENEGMALGELQAAPKTKTETTRRIRKLRKHRKEYDDGTHSVVRDRDGVHVVRNDNQVETSPRKKREVMKKYVRENFDSIEETGAVEAAIDWDINRPVRAKKEDIGLTKEQIIAEELGGMSVEEFERFGDKNTLPASAVKAYSMDSRAGRNVDTEIEALNEQYFGGREEITPEDVVAFIQKYPEGKKQFEQEYARQQAEAGTPVDLDMRDSAADAFRQRAGFDITPALADAMFQELDYRESGRKTEDELRAAEEAEFPQRAKDEARMAAEDAQQMTIDGSVELANREEPQQQRTYGPSSPGGEIRKSKLWPRLPKEVRDAIDGISEKGEEYVQQKQADLNSIAQVIMNRVGGTLRDKFEASKMAGIPLEVAMMMKAKLLYAATEAKDTQLVGEIGADMRRMGESIGRAGAVMKSDSSPEMRALTMKGAADAGKERKMNEPGVADPDKTLGQELDGLYDEVKPKQEEVDKAIDNAEAELAKADEALAKQAEAEAKKKAARKAKIREANRKIKDGVDLLLGKNNQGTLSASFVGLTPSQIKGLKLIAEGIVSKGAVKFRQFAAKMRDVLKRAGVARNVWADYISNAWQDQLSNPNSLVQSARKQAQNAATESLASKVLARAKDNPPKTKDPLDMIADELLSKASEVVPKKKRDKKPAKEKLAFMIRNNDVAQEMWDDAKKVVEAKIDADDGLTQIEKDDLKAKLQDWYNTALDMPYGKARAREAIREGLKDLGTTIREIARKHFEARENDTSTLAEKIVDGTGLSPAQAQRLADGISNEIRQMIEERQVAAMEQYLEKATAPKEKKVRRRTIERIVDLINMGALTRDGFKGAFADVFGFANVTPEIMQKVHDMIKVINTVEDGEFRRKALAEFEVFMDKQDNAHAWFYASGIITEQMYINMLSGPTTLLRAGTGATMSVAANVGFSVISKALRGVFKLKQKPFKMLGMALSAFAKQAKVGVPFFKSIMRDGYSELEATDDKGNYSPLREIINKGFREHVKKGDIGKAAYTFAWYIPAKMFRALIGMDAIFHYAQKGYFSVVEAHNQLLAEGMDARTKEFWTKMHTIMADGEVFRKHAEAQAERELALLRAAGQKVTPEYKAKRVQEIIEKERGDAINDYARYRAKDGTLTKEPEGGLARVYKAFSFVANFEKGDPPHHIIAGIFAKMIFPILRVPTNSINMWLDYTPIGLARAIFPFMTSGRNKGNLTPRQQADIRWETFMKAAAGISLWMGLFMRSFEIEEDEEGNEYVTLNKDVTITASGWPGRSGWKKNASISKDFQPFTFGIGPVKFNYRDTPMGLTFSSIGYMADAIRYSENGRVSAKNFTETMAWVGEAGIIQAATMVKEQNYFQGVDRVGRIISGDVGELSKLAMAPVTTLTMPNVYKQAAKGTYDALDLDKKYAFRVNKSIPLSVRDNIMKNIPVLDRYIANSQFDQLGYPIKEKLELPLMQEIFSIFEDQSKKPEWELIYKYPEVTLGDYITAPRDMNDPQDMYDFEKECAEELRKRIRFSLDALNERSPKVLQKWIAKTKSEIKKLKKAEWQYKGRYNPK